MNNEELEKTLRENIKLAPRNDLKEEIITRAAREISSSDVKSKKERPKFYWMKIFAPIAACFILIVMVWGGVFINEDAGSIYVEVNPSVTLVVNNAERVKEVIYTNDDAKKDLSNVKLKGKKIEDALVAMLERYDKVGYFNDAEIYISVYSDKNKNMEKLVERLVMRAEKEKCDKGYSYNVNTIKISKDDKDEAEKNGISPAKQNIINEILSKSSDYTFDELKGMKMSQLKGILKALEK